MGLMLDPETERRLSDMGIPECDIDELRKFSEFLAKRKEYRKARDEGKVTDEMRRKYVDLINSLDK